MAARFQQQPASLADGAPRPGGGSERSGLLLSAVWPVVNAGALVAVFATLAVLELRRWQASGQLLCLGLLGEQLLLAALILCRRQAQRGMFSPGTCIAAAGGTWLPLLLRPAGPALFGLQGVGMAVQLAGAAGALVSLATLGRSFGILAADRGLQCDGVYALVRHPAYLSYLLIECGFLLQNPSGWNAAVVALATACQIGRIRAEERLLGADLRYRAYAARVRFRLVPGLY